MTRGSAVTGSSSATRVQSTRWTMAAFLLEGAAGSESQRVAATTSLWHPRRQVRVVAATTSLRGSPEAGQMGTERQAVQAGQECPERS